MEQNLLFFNKEGYPYNFIYNKDNERYEGKIYFDKNSNDTFKTQALYVFEDVPSQELTDNFQFETFRMFDYSGISFIKGTEKEIIIKDIRKVNSSVSFYSKWIIGDNFDKLFPRGSMVRFRNFTENSFDNPTAYLDFTENPYFTVIDNKPDAIMVLTPTINSNWNYVFDTKNDNEIIISQNYILLNDYSGDIVSNISDIKLDPGQAINVYNTLDDNNNGIYITDERYYTEIFYDKFNISGGTSGDTLNIKLELFTERPKIYEGPISGTINISGNSEIKFSNGLNSLFERDDFLNFTTGSTIIFEDLDDNTLFNNSIFTVSGMNDRLELGEYVVEFQKTLDEEQTLLNISNTNNSLYDWILAEPTIENLEQIDTRYKTYDYYLKISNDNIFQLQNFYNSKYVIQSGYTTILDYETSGNTNSYLNIITGLIDHSLISFESTIISDYYLSHDFENGNKTIKFRKYGINLNETDYDLVKNYYNTNKFTNELISRALGKEIFIKDINLTYYTDKSKWSFINNSDNFDYNETNDVSFTHDISYVEFHVDTPTATDESMSLTWKNTYNKSVDMKITGEIWYKYKGDVIVNIDGIEQYRFNYPPYILSNIETQIWNNKIFTISSGSTIEFLLTNRGSESSEVKLKIKKISLYFTHIKPSFNFRKSPELQSAIESIENELSISDFDTKFKMAYDFLKSELLVNEFTDLYKQYNISLNKDSLSNLFYTHINDNFSDSTSWILTAQGTNQTKIEDNKLKFINNGDYKTKGYVLRNDIYFKENKTIRITFDLTIEDGDNPDISISFLDKNDNIFQKDNLTTINGLNSNDVLVTKNTFKFKINLNQTAQGNSYIENLKIQYVISNEKASALKIIENNYVSLNLNDFEETFDDVSDIFLGRINFFKSATFKNVNSLAYSDKLQLSSFESYNFPNYYIFADTSLTLEPFSNTGTYPEQTSFNLTKKSKIEENVKLLDELLFEVNDINQNLNTNKKVKIIDIISNPNDELWSNIKYKLETPVNAEDWVTYKISKIFKSYEIDTLYCTTSYSGTLEFDYSAVTYLTTNKIILEQEYLDTYKNTIESFINRYRNNLIKTGIYVYSENTSEIIFEGMYSYNEDDSNGYSDYFNLDAYYTSISGNTIISGLPTKEIGRFWIRTYDNFIETKKIPIYSDEKGRNHKIEIDFDLNKNQQNYGVRIKLNSVDFYVNFDTNTETTLSNFVSTQSFKYLNNAILIESSGNTLFINGLLPDVFIWDIDITTNYYSSYKIVKNIPNQGIIIESSQLVNEWTGYTGIDFIENTELSTGMVISTSGNTSLPTGLTFLDGKDYNIINLLSHRIQLSYQGYLTQFSSTTYDNMISEIVDIGKLFIKSDKFIRRPRMGSIDSHVFPGAFFRSLSRAFDIRYFEQGDGKDFYFRFKWEDDQGSDPDIFYYDFSGEQQNLIYGPKDNSGSYIKDLKYTGIRPLYDIDKNNLVVLNKDYNTNINYTTKPDKQQTIFDELDFLLDKRNSRNAELLPEPVQTFIGFQSQDEGVSQRTMIMELVEHLTFSGYTNSENNPTNVEFNLLLGSTTGTSSTTITYIDLLFTGETSGQTDFSFKKYGFTVDQLITLKFNDLSEINQRIFENYDTYKITRVSKTEIDISILNKNYVDFVSSGTTGGFYFEINVEPNEILRCQLFGETEIEDERFKVNLRNLGIRIDDDIEHLFKQSDLDDNGIDYILINEKRKEMLLNYPDLYNYIGSYKALINALKFFGYEDLELFEYYRNINPNSPMYQKLQKVLVKDIFNREIEGYTKEDWVAKQNDINNFKKTSLFNLTYKITDDDGNYVLFYSLDEVQQKLEGVKKWLRRYILPLSSNIIDVTGLVETKENIKLFTEVSNQIIKFTTDRESTGIDFFIEQTLNFETNYLATIHWYNIDKNFDATKGWSFRLKTFSLNNDNKLIPQQSFEIDKFDLEFFSFNYNKDLDPYVWLETTYYDNNGFGIVHEIVQNMQISRNYYLINHKLIPYRTGPKYLNLVDKNKNGEIKNGFYFFDKNGFMVLSDEISNIKYPKI